MRLKTSATIAILSGTLCVSFFSFFSRTPNIEKIGSGIIKSSPSYERKTPFLCTRSFCPPRRQLGTICRSPLARLPRCSRLKVKVGFTGNPSAFRQLWLSFARALSNIIKSPSVSKNSVGYSSDNLEISA